MVLVVNPLIHFLKTTMRRIGSWASFYSQFYSECLTAVQSVVIKVGMVGDSQIGKTSLMVKYVEGSFDEDYIQTLGTSLRTNRLIQ